MAYLKPDRLENLPNSTDGGWMVVVKDIYGTEHRWLASNAWMQHPSGRPLVEVGICDSKEDKSWLADKSGCHLTYHVDSYLCVTPPNPCLVTGARKIWVPAETVLTLRDVSNAVGQELRRMVVQKKMDFTAPF